MSSAVASAKKRRGVSAVNTPGPIIGSQQNNTIRPQVQQPQTNVPPGQQPPNNLIQSGLSLPQIINIIDRRLIALESKQTNPLLTTPTNIQETFDEYN
jgi:hypothetical protein